MSKGYEIMKKLYLALPYSGQENYSFRKANYQAGMLMDQGYVVYSPISHTHPIALECHLTILCRPVFGMDT